MEFKRIEDLMGDNNVVLDLSALHKSVLARQDNPRQIGFSGYARFMWS